MLIIENEWIDGTKQGGKAEAPWILITTAFKEAKKGPVRVQSKGISWSTSCYLKKSQQL